jgi:Mg2+-importing ATPase
VNSPSYQFSQLSKEDLLARLGVDGQGLTASQASERLATAGRNTLRVKRPYRTLRLFLSQFNTPIMYLLIIAAILSFGTANKVDALIIFGIILVSALLSFFQEFTAVSQMRKLLAMVQVRANVIRDGSEREIPLEEVAPGDLIVLRAGDMIPGDCYLLESKNLIVDEATLTGETQAVEKTPGQMAGDLPISKRSNTLFMGTHVISGTGKAIVVQTGKATEFGSIADRLTHKPPETNFEHGVRRFGYFLLVVTLVMLIVIFFLNVLLARPVIESLLFASALAVGMTPQLLPAIISVNLAHGATLIAKRGVIVKRLASIENFGSMTVLCSDKTGTLTTGQIVLQSAFNAEGQASDRVMLYALINAKFQTGYINPIDKAINQASTTDLSAWNRISEVPYDFDRRKLTVLMGGPEGSLLISKGAFHEILNVCTQVQLSNGSLVDIQEQREALENRFTEYGQQGLRVLGLAYRPAEGISVASAQDENQMIFLGFLLFWDPPKEDIVETIKGLQELGVNLRIITGDNHLVAQSIAKALGIPQDKVLTGDELRRMVGPGQERLIEDKVIFAEIEPNQKEQIILALRYSGHIVGYLGDGINDVTALHAADVGISVDSGADAAKEVADIILLQKDLDVLQEGVKAGRRTFANTLKYVFMSTSANFGNMFSLAGASLIFSFLPLLPKQVLLVNLMTDFPEMTIATDRVDAEWVQRPVRWDMKFINKFMLIFGLISSIFDYATFGVLTLLGATVAQFRTGWFMESVISASLIVLAIRTFKPLWTSMPSRYLLWTVIFIVILTCILPLIPDVAFELGFVPLPWNFYLIVAGIVACYIGMVELAKKIFLKRAFPN